MADLTSASVTAITSHTRVLGDKTCKRTVVVKKLRIVLSAQGSGGTGAKIPASALGFDYLCYASPLSNINNIEVVVAAVKDNGSELLLKAAADNTLANYTGTYNVLVAGTDQHT